MPFKLLKQVITHLKESSKCPSCSGKFDDDSIFVLATGISPESHHGIFFIICQKCFSQAIVLAEVNSLTQQLKRENIRIETKPAPAGMSVGANDVIDMHNFLKDWKGNVKELF